MSDIVIKPRTKVRAKVERPRLYKVILVNDDFTPREFVVTVLKGEFKLSEDQAQLCDGITQDDEHVLQHLRFFLGVGLGRQDAQFAEHGEEFRIGFEAGNERYEALFCRFVAGKKSNVAIGLFPPRTLFGQQEVTESGPMPMIREVLHMGDMCQRVQG